MQSKLFRATTCALAAVLGGSHICATAGAIARPLVVPLMNVEHRIALYASGNTQADMATYASKEEAATIRRLESSQDWIRAGLTLRNDEFLQGTEGWERASSNGLTVSVKLRSNPQGTAAVCLALPKTVPNGWASFRQVIRADHYRGKRVRLTALIRTDSVVRAFLGAVTDGSTIQQFGAKRIKGTAAWQKTEVVFDVPEDSQHIILGFGVAGSGSRTWIAEPKLEAVARNVPISAIEASRMKPGP